MTLYMSSAKITTFSKSTLTEKRFSRTINSM